MGDEEDGNGCEQKGIFAWVGSIQKIIGPSVACHFGNRLLMTECHLRMKACISTLLYLNYNENGEAGPEHW